MIEGLSIAIEGFSSFMPWLMVLVGVVLGVLGGAMPGLSPSTSVALLVPFSYTLEPHLALILLTSIYIAANYGGSITAILINTPGTPAASVTALDGYPLTKKGRAHEALGMALSASCLGGMIGVLVLILFAVPLSSWALKLGPAEYFALAFLGLSTVASMGKGQSLNALIGACIGLLLATVGLDPISGEARFTFDWDPLFDGFHVIPALIGLFALSGVFEEMAGGLPKRLIAPAVEKFSLSWKKLRNYSPTVFISSLIGTIIGIFPGAGATIASFISYDWAKRKQKDENFGEGSLHGVAAAEGANSSSVGGALIPLLALGIPGSATDAVLLGAFMLHDLVPGPLLFTENPAIPYGIFVGLLVANFFLLFLGIYGNRFFLQITKLPKSYLNSFILVLAIVGSYTVNSSLWDATFCLAFGFLGWFLKAHKIPMAPVVLGLVLGDMMEQNLRRALLMEGPQIFWQRPLSAAFLAISFISILWPLLKSRVKKSI